MNNQLSTVVAKLQEIWTIISSTTRDSEEDYIVKVVNVFREAKLVSGLPPLDDDLKRCSDDRPFYVGNEHNYLEIARDGSGNIGISYVYNLPTEVVLKKLDSIIESLSKRHITKRTESDPISTVWKYLNEKVRETFGICPTISYHPTSDAIPGSYPGPYWEIEFKLMPKDELKLEKLIKQMESNLIPLKVGMGVERIPSNENSIEGIRIRGASAAYLSGVIKGIQKQNTLV